MEQLSGRVRDLKVAYIGGGSRGWAWGFMQDLAMDAQMEGKVALYDIDHDAARKNQRIGEMISSHPQAKSRWRYEVSGSLGEALTGADFVVISILPGTLRDAVDGIGRSGTASGSRWATPWAPAGSSAPCAQCPCLRHCWAIRDHAPGPG